MSPVHVRSYPRRVKASSRYVRRTPPDSDRNILAPRIAELHEALEKRVGAYGAMKGVPLSETQIRNVEKTSEITREEHDAFQDTQAWAHASGIISTSEAQVIYMALGEMGTQTNGGWAHGTDLATKVIVLKTLQELLGMKLRMEGRM